MPATDEQAAESIAGEVLVELRDARCCASSLQPGVPVTTAKP